MSAFFPSSLIAQPAPSDAAVEPEPTWPFEARAAEWKEIDPAVLKVDHHPADSNATAVILSDVGESYFDHGGRLRYKRHTRIKLLSEAAYDEHATVEIRFLKEKNKERVKGIDGHTFILDDEGDVQRIELDNDDVFEEEITDTYNRMTFTLPNLEPGAVIEYRYEIKAQETLNLPGWTFQTGEPTVYSQYETRIPNALTYAQLRRGSQRFDAEETTDGQNHTGYTWVAKNVPALREEPFMTTVEDYRLAVRFQLQSIVTNTGYTENVMESWPEVAKSLMDHDVFGKQLGRHGDVKDQAESLVASLSAKPEKAKALYDFVSETMVWNDRNRVYASDDLDQILGRRRGSSADINMLLCSMLQIADIEAYPVLISTRSHGAAVPLYPFLQQFNSVIVAAKVGDSFVLLDGTDPNRPFGQLPTRALNKQGWMVVEENPTWIQIQPTGLASRSTLVSATVDPNGSVTSSVSVTDKSYQAYQSRKSLRDADSPEEYVGENLLSTESIVKSVKTSGETRDDDQLRVSTKVELPAYAQVAGDFIYLNPMIVGRQDEAVFTKETRTFPVDLPFPILDQYTFTLKVPDGYEVKQLPEQRVIRSGEEVVFQRIIQESGSMISMRITMFVKKTQFPPEEYPDLRDFFSDIVSAHSEPIVLRKAAPENASEETSREASASTTDSSTGDDK